MNVKIVRILALAALVTVAGAWWLRAPGVTPIAVRLATTRSPFAATVWLAASRGYFRAEGLDATVIPYATGKLALAGLLEGAADFATAADTPIVLALIDGRPARVLATLGTSTDATEVVARRDRGIASGRDLAGHRIGVVAGTNSPYFLDTFLDISGVPAHRVERVPLEVGALAAALTAGEVDAISAWSPYTTEATQRLGDGAVSLSAGGLYRWSWNLVALDGPQPAGPAVLRALLRASAQLRRDATRAAAELAGPLGTPAASLAREWRHTQFEVALDQALLINFEMQARWAIACGLARPGAMPNFLPAMAPGPLRAIDPTLVTIIDGKDRR